MPGGRPRKYPQPAAAVQAHAQRERAQRARMIAVERAAVEALMQAVEQAAAADNATARLVRTGTPESLLRNLAYWFRAGTGPTG